MRAHSQLLVTLTAVIATSSFAAACASEDPGAPSGNGASSSSSSGSGGDSNTPGAPGASSSGGAPGGSSSGGASGGGTDTTPSGPLTPLQKRKAEMLTSIWENSTTVLQYGFSQNIGDGRGYTSGRAGFCSGTGDAFLVVKCFDKKFGTGAANVMHKYEAALEQLELQAIESGEPQGDTGGLDDIGSYSADWKKTATDPATAAMFNGCQDELVYEHYFKPSVATADKAGLSRALTIAVLYDATIVHGNEGTAELVNGANEATGNAGGGGAKLSQDAESKWLEAFLTRRLARLRDAGGDSVDRGALYEQLRRDGNWDLGATIVTNAKAHKMFPNEGYEDSHYPSCTIDAAGAVSGDAACTK